MDTEAKAKGEDFLWGIPGHQTRIWTFAFVEDDLLEEYGKDAARLSMARWYNKVDESGLKQSNVIAATFYEHYDEILNFYNNRASNALAESFNAKIKDLRRQFKGINDTAFFLFRLSALYG